MTSGKQKGKAVPSSGSLNVYLQDAVMQVERKMVLSAFAWDGDPSIWTVRLGCRFQIGETCAMLSTKVRAAAAPGRNFDDRALHGYRTLHSISNLQLADKGFGGYYGRETM
jgi:hypothetical protein